MGASSHSGFHDRLRRIEQGGANTMGHIYVGPPSDEELATRKLKSSGARKSRSGASGSAVVALVLGVAAFAGARLGLFHFVSENGVYSLDRFGEQGATYLASFGDFAGAAVLALVLLVLFRQRGLVLKGIAFAGIGLAVFGEAQLAARAPDVYAGLTSDSYAAPQVAPAGSAVTRSASTD